MGSPSGLAVVAAWLPGGPVVTESLSVAELGLLIKFLTALPELPKIEAGDPHTRGERVQLWRASVEGALGAARPVVAEWWRWSWDWPTPCIGAGLLYRPWSVRD